MTARRNTLAGLAVAGALLAAGCGSSDEKREPSLPPATVAKLNERLDVVQRQLDAGGGACADIANTTRPVIESDLEGLPDSVDADARKALTDSFDRLFALVEEQCDAAEPPPPTTTPEPEPEPVPTETQETQTEETQTQETVPTEPEKPKKPEKPKGGGNDGGGGGGGDGGAGFGDGE